MAVTTNDKFDIKIVHDNFMSAIHEEDDIQLKYYLDSFNELNKFFNLMGSVFGFVSSDLQQKMDILVKFVEDETISNNFVSVKAMVHYELKEGLLNKKDYVSGSRTLLRLHRGLDFIRAFMKAIGDIKSDDKTSHVCHEAYDKTLAQYHPWLIRKGAKMAMYTLPTRDNLLIRVCGGTPEDVQRSLDILPKMLEITSEVYNRIETLYTVNDLHSLP